MEVRGEPAERAVEMTEYQGHKDWGHWNVSLWINNDEGLYRWAVELVEEHGQREAARLMAEDLGGTETPDGATYTTERIYAAMNEMVADCEP